MSTLFPVLCSAEFSSLGKQLRILPKCTFFVCAQSVSLAKLRPDPGEARQRKKKKPRSAQG